jgi:hypothetical protein
MLVVSLALSDMGFCATNGFPLFTIAAFQKIWRWGPIGECVPRSQTGV